MFRHSFFYNDERKTMDEITQFIKKTKKPIVYTYGLGYKHPTTYRIPISKEDVMLKIKRNSMTDIMEEEEVVHVNQYSDNDMW